MSDMMSTQARLAQRRNGADYGSLAQMIAAMRDEIKAEVLAEVRAEIAAQNVVVQAVRDALSGLTRQVAPVVNVPPAQVTVMPAEVSVNAPVSVSPADVKVLPSPPGGGVKAIQIHRDPRGAITGATVREG